MRALCCRHLMSDPKARKVIVIENPLLPTRVKEVIAEVLFDNLQVRLPPQVALLLCRLAQVSPDHARSHPQTTADTLVVLNRYHRSASPALPFSRSSPPAPRPASSSTSATSRPQSSRYAPQVSALLRGRFVVLTTSTHSFVDLSHPAALSTPPLGPPRRRSSVAPPPGAPSPVRPLRPTSELAQLDNYSDRRSRTARSTDGRLHRVAQDALLLCGRGPHERTGGRGGGGAALVGAGEDAGRGSDGGENRGGVRGGGG